MITTSESFGPGKGPAEGPGAGGALEPALKSNQAVTDDKHLEPWYPLIS